MTTEEVMTELGLSRTGLSSLANRNKIGKLRIGKDGRAHRNFTEADLEILRSRIGKRGRPPKEPNVARKSDQEPVETSLGAEEKA